MRESIRTFVVKKRSAFEALPPELSVRSNQMDLPFDGNSGVSVQKIYLFSFLLIPLKQWCLQES